MTIMDMDTKLVFKVKALGFPTGEIYQMYVWVKGNLANAGKYIDDHADEIKESLKETMYIHSIEHYYTTYSNNKPEPEEFGDIILDKEIKIGSKKSKKKKEVKPVTDINKVDLPNIDNKDLGRLKQRIVNELFKREHDLSGDVFSFFVANQDQISVEEAKRLCEEHGSVDMFLLKKREVRKKVEEKISSK